jgi:hypothetical protein
MDPSSSGTEIPIRDSSFVPQLPCSGKHLFSDALMPALA